VSFLVNKYKICVYTIAKNEEKNVDKWVDSMSEADYICVLDTGSTDSTVEKLRARGVIVEQKTISPWRFDVARNESMKLIPKDTDICVSTDLDELFDKGWAKTLRNEWEPDKYKMGRYYYVFQHTATGGEADSFYRDKIHTNDPMFKWIFPIHEVLARPEGMPEKLFPRIICHHWQNMQTVRKSYLTLMEMEYSEHPTNTRNLFLLGREYYIYQNWEMAIKRLEEFVEIGPRKILYEKGFALALIGYSHMQMHRINDARFSFMRSINVFPKFRIAYLGLATTYLIAKDYVQTIEHTNMALAIKERFMLFSDEGAAWEDKPYKILFEAYANTQQFKEALQCIKFIKKFDSDKMWDENLKKIQAAVDQTKYGGMSYPDFKEETLRYIKTHYGKNCSILDVGPGDGAYGKLLNTYTKDIDAVEYYKPYIDFFKLSEIYKNVYNADVCDFEFEYYDVIIIGDVLEHISIEGAQKLLDYMYDRADEIIIAVPYNYEQAPVHGNEKQAHLQPDLTHELFLERYPRFKEFARNERYGVYIKNV
jgi:tetratricopeptide (TPR) repeat protein